MKLFVDTKRISSNSWNIGHGNKISHLFFVLNLAEKLGVKPILTANSSLDSIFDLSAIKKTEESDEVVDCIYEEQSAFLELNLLQKALSKLGIFLSVNDSLKKVIERSLRQKKEEQELLQTLPKFEEGYAKGHFWHYQLMPSEKTLNKHINIKPSILEECIAKYPDLRDKNSVMVHLRDTDFNSHLRHIFKKSIALPEEYYSKSIELCESKLGPNLKYHLFSDNREKITNIFKGKNYVLHEDNAAMDWACLYQGENIIQSNSSFCWTASLFKKFSIQPAGGYNWAYSRLGSVPHGFEMPFSQLINLNLD
ncbi:hypothetical protein [Zobellia alginiliquefaciens]|uniref:hypothetical protein n=1 Tax=Zobellia alginiliquefaciens TaxID=3032586 RepID=UPI0023E30B4D|nr:hypothetical protein [Zobellia alginiliquefaciens]